jgi:hypothetical protein
MSSGREPEREAPSDKPARLATQRLDPLQLEASHLGEPEAAPANDN